MEVSFFTSRTTRGIFSFIIEHTEGSLPSSDAYSKSEINKLDHVVINTNDADGLIRVYKDIFNIRLALDNVIEHWKSRMLFFRVNKTTIEVIAKKDVTNIIRVLFFQVSKIISTISNSSS